MSASVYSQRAAACVGFAIAAVAVARQAPSSLTDVVDFDFVYQYLGSVAEFGSPAQWMVALLGLALCPALSLGSAVARCTPTPRTGIAASTAPSTQDSRQCGSHSIHLDHDHEQEHEHDLYGNLQSPFATHARTRALSTSSANSGGLGHCAGTVSLVRRLGRLLAEGRSQARRLVGREAGLVRGGAGFTRKRSFNSRSSNKSEDVLSSRLSTDSLLRGSRSRGLRRSSGGGNGSGGGGSSSGGGGLSRRGSGGLGGCGRWQPSMSRIASGQHLADMDMDVRGGGGADGSESSCSSANGGKRLELLSYNGFQAVDCLAHERTDADFAEVRQVVTDTHLLQFGAMIGEASAELALSQAGSPGAVGREPACLFGMYDKREQYREGWELVVEEHKPGLHYWAWRRPLRRGLYMVKSKTLYEGASPQQLLPFTFDMDFRKTWDENMNCQLPIPPPSACPPAANGAKPNPAHMTMTMAAAAAKSGGASGNGGAAGSAFMYARTKFPPPMAQREYTYARRVWAKPDDGGMYMVSRACRHPCPPATGGRVVRVDDFASGTVIRSSKGLYDSSSPAVELVNVYFEDPGVPAGIANMGIRRALWPFVQKTEAAFRDYVLTRVHGGLEQPPPEPEPPSDSLGAELQPLAAARPHGAAAAEAPSMAADALDAGSLARRWLKAGLALRLGSPYVLVYRGYVAAWRGCTAAALSALSALWSAWANATGLGVGALAAGRAAVTAVASKARAALRGGKDGKGGGARAVVGRLLSSPLLWPWELVWRGRGPKAAGMEGLQRTESSGGVSVASSGASRLASHPIRRSMDVTRPRGGAGAAAAAAGSGGGGLGRRAALLAMKVVKVAGAGLLLGRAAQAPATAPSGGRAAGGTTAAASAAAAGGPVRSSLDAARRQQAGAGTGGGAQARQQQGPQAVRLGAAGVRQADQQRQQQQQQGAGARPGLWAQQQQNQQQQAAQHGRTGHHHHHHAQQQHHQHGEARAQALVSARRVLPPPGPVW